VAERARLAFVALGGGLAGYCAGYVRQRRPAVHDRRTGLDRRVAQHAVQLDRRSGGDRRSGRDRRTGWDRRRSRFSTFG